MFFLSLALRKKARRGMVNGEGGVWGGRVVCGVMCGVMWVVCGERW